VTRSRKRGASFVVGRGAAHSRTVGSTTYTDRDGTRQSVDVQSDDDADFDIVRESWVVREGNRLLAESAGMAVTSPMGNVTVWDDEHRLGGFGLTDTPYASFADARAMRQQVYGGNDGRGMVDATYVVDALGESWCDRCDCDATECDCQYDHRARASIGACAVQRFTAADVMAAPVGHDGETTVRDANRTRLSAPVYLSRDEWATLDLGAVDAQGRKLRGVVVGNVTHLVGPSGCGAALGHAPMPRKRAAKSRATATNRAARRRSARAGRELTARRDALAADLVGIMETLTVGAARPVDGHDVKVKRTRRDRWTIGAMSGGNVATLAKRAARELVTS
jgi:hypothetical protein